ncbi:alpha/beta hydrolase [Acetobacteraceae bacterium KSS8]|uniref:Alpha/beta hydrolase n=1 Tax=Endosaccharibacter trunci TaxID=2812733 RepID=A0ABT1W7P3_9PROT|nr:alpha/beta hydrolase [Acetobacteraceae bacterium KSS8]
MINRRSDLTADFIEHRIAQGPGALFVRDYPCNGPAFALLHGFPDDGHIYDDLIPHLAFAGRRTVTIDFPGFGASDRPGGTHYGFPQQVRDVEAVIAALSIDRAVLVGHDAGGPAAMNFALRHPDTAHGVVPLNVFYGEAPGLPVPELIELFSHPRLSAVARHLLQSPEHFAWLLEFQRELLLADASPAGQERYSDSGVASA